MSSLETAISTLQNDHSSGASVLATQSLNLLIPLINETENPFIAQHLWESICSYGFALKNARPSMDAAIGGALIAALTNVKRRWDAEFGEGWPSGGCRGSRMKSAAVAAVEETLEGRKKALVRLTEIFSAWIKARCQALGGRPVRVLTLSYSSSLKACLVAALKDIPELGIELKIMESRPSFEGAFLGLTLLKDIGQAGTHRLSVQVESDASVTMLAKDVDIVLLGADCISRSGCVSNKTGSLAAVLCAKALSPTAEVVVVSESEKIVVDADLKHHAEEENDSSEIRAAWGERWEGMEKEVSSAGAGEVVTRNVYFETVEEKYVDCYICEIGILSRADVNRVSLERGLKEEEIFGQFKEDCAEKEKS